MESDKPNRFIAGLSEPEEPQSPIGTENDPQRIVLRQYLQTLKSRGETTAIVDVGSGLGVLAAEIEKVWPDSTPPTYVAVDLPGYLDKLAIPPQLHNNSKKFYFDDFFQNRISDYSSNSVKYVVRNVIHELSILETTRLIVQLTSCIQKGCEVYVQDMTNLPRAERGNIGWESEELADLFRFSGFQVTKMEVTGRSGTTWFSFIATRSVETSSQEDILQKCIERRRAQKKRLSQEFAEAQNSSAPNAPDLILRRGMEIATLEGQIEDAQSILAKIEPQSGRYLQIGSARVPLRSPRSNQSSSTGPSFEGLAGLIGIEGALVNKDQIDFGKLISQAAHRYWSVGYSQKSMFITEQNRTAFMGAVSRGVEVKLIVADPSSALVRSVSRARSSGGAPAQALSVQIEGTLKLCQEFKDSLAGTGFEGRFSVRTVGEPFAGSYFFVDDLCFFSIYGRSITGSRAPCLIFGKRTARLAGIYEILEEDFVSLWSSDGVEAGVDHEE
jgi:hypothetical protein